MLIHFQKQHLAALPVKERTFLILGIGSQIPLRNLETKKMIHPDAYCSQMLQEYLDSVV